MNKTAVRKKIIQFFKEFFFFVLRFCLPPCWQCHLLVSGGNAPFKIPFVPVCRMPPVKYVPRFGPQLSSSQRTEFGSDHLVNSTPSETDERGKKRNKKKREKAEKPLLKVKFPNVKSRAASPKATADAKTSTKWMLKSSSSKNNPSLNQEKQTECYINILWKWQASLY